MQTSLSSAQTFTLGSERPGLSLRRDDRGNWTLGDVGAGTLIGSSCGVSAPVLCEWLGRTATAADMRAVTPATMRAIFGANYWNRLACDSLPIGVDLQTSDHGYNRGAATSAMVLQRLLGQNTDGWIGSETIAAIAAFRTSTLSFEHLDARALQEGFGLRQDGIVGPMTRAALAAIPPVDALLVALYAAQVEDYWSLPEAAANPGWFVRARDRLARARALRSAA